MSVASSYGGPTSSQPNNTYIRTMNSRYHSTIRFAIYCCSGYNNSHIGSFRNPSGRVKTTGYEHYSISQYSSSNSYAGCISMNSRFSTYRHRYCYWFDNYGNCRSYTTGYLESWSPASGVYTCNIPDENGIMQHVGFTLHSSSGILYS